MVKLGNVVPPIRFECGVAKISDAYVAELRDVLDGMQHLKTQELAQDAWILVRPGVVTGRAGSHQSPGTDRSYRLDIVPGQIGHVAAHPGNL